MATARTVFRVELLVQAQAIAIGGNTSSYLPISEEFTSSVNVITVDSISIT